MMKIPIYFVILFLTLSCVEDDILITEQEIVNKIDTPKIINYTYLFTEQAKNTLKERFETDYVTGSGFTSDFSHIKDALPDFLTSPDKYRPEFGLNWNITRGGEIIHQAGLYAYAMEDVEIANVVAAELLETINMNDLKDPFWDINHNFSIHYALMIQTSKVKKLKDTYYLIKGLTDILTENEKNDIETWFKDYKNLVQNWFMSRMDHYLGANWENIGISRAYPEGLFPIQYNDPFPIKNSKGNNMVEYAVTWFQDHFNNRVLDQVAYLHSWAVYNEDLELEHCTREFFKLAIKYVTWSDGTYWELIRNNSKDNTLGVFYTNISLTSLIYMAHLDSQANHFPNDKLYDFKTTDGIIKGSTNLTVKPYLGGSTTDGITKKSIKTLIMGQSKYLRNSANGGWNDVRFNNGKPMSTVNTRENSVIAAIANIYYQDKDLKDYYLYNTSVGYPQKFAIYEGYGTAEDSGGWANLIIGGAWFEQEQNYNKF
ncbi:hypothetical protein [Lutibacter citreus]|uniref:hypothetical protein n=1 Tax=Lutibacter citreus TaxID=2138210 RepID=UPI0013007819|nr:hypothetical protein [Lutibacter citreus]